MARSAHNIYYVPSRRNMAEPKFGGLATELLTNIFTSLSRRDLVHVVQVCKSFTMPGRMILYQHIDLRSDDPHVGYTLHLLSRYQSIEKRIVSAILTTMPPPQSRQQILHPSWIDAWIAQHWSNLKSLELRGYPFSGVQASDHFVNTLLNSCQQLKYFTFRPGFGSLPGNFDLTRLQGVTWHSGHGTEDLPIIPTMHASRRSITRISFSGTITFKANGPYHTFLQDLLFPSLQWLELGSLMDTDNAVQANTAITRFILAHPRISHLSLGRTRAPNDTNGPGENDVFFQFDGNYLQRDSLPALQTFEGFLENVTVLATHVVHSIFTITSLSIYCPHKDAQLTEKFNQMHSAVIQAQMPPKKFPFVTYLRFEFFTELHHLMPLNTTSLAHRECMDHLSQLCPGVVSWYGRLPPMTSAHLASMFKMYDNMEAISLPWSTLFIHIGSSSFEYFQGIARVCTKLKKVIARKPEYGEGDNHIFMLDRDINGILTSVTTFTTPDEAFN